MKKIVTTKLTQNIKKIIVIIGVYVLLINTYGCDSTITGSQYPSEQKSFIESIKSHQIDYQEAEGNDVTQDNVCNSLRNFVENRNCANWEADVVEVNSILGNRWVVLECDAIIFKIWPERDDTWEEIGESILSDLRPGDKVLFSGKIIREMSLTCGGMISEPEIKVEPTSITVK